MSQAREHKNTSLKFIATSFFAILAVVIVGAGGSAVARPIECTDNTTQSCSTPTPIPAGCPGSTVQGPPSIPLSECPSATPTTAAPTSNTGAASNSKTGPHCGFASNDEKTNQAVYTSFEIGCQGRGNPIMDAAFALIRFLSIGVGLIIVGSLTYAGIQYTAARGDPKAAGEAKERIKSNVVAFFIYVLSSALLNFVVPQGFFK